MFWTSLLPLLLTITIINAAPAPTEWTPLIKSRAIYDRERLPVSSTAAMLQLLESGLMRNISHSWNLFKNTFAKQYRSILEEGERFFIFAQNFVRIMEHNMEYKAGKHTYEMGINTLSDQSTSEISKRRGYRYSHKARRYENPRFFDITATLPDEVDWRKKGAVTPVKDQGQCGSCWAFSATGAIEGQHFRKNAQLLSMSEQQLVDCSSKFGNNGCNGGLMDYAFKYVKSNNGIDSEEYYPYESGDTGRESTCKYNASAKVATVVGLVDIKHKNENDLKIAVATRGPVSIAINAALPSFPLYKSGVYSDPTCYGDPEDLDHGVLVVGYGVDRGTPYWLVKNSWGPLWGDHGYIRILRNGTNMCGIATAASYPLV